MRASAPSANEPTTAAITKDPAAALRPAKFQQRPAPDRLNGRSRGRFIECNRASKDRSWPLIGRMARQVVGDLEPADLTLRPDV